MDQGVIYMAKRLYKKRFLNEVRKLKRLPMEKTKGGNKLQNLKNYNMWSMIYNFADAVKDIKTLTLMNAWKKLLLDEDMDPNENGVRCKIFMKPCFEEKSRLWTVTVAESSEDEEGEGEGEASNLSKVKLSDVKEHLSHVIQFVEESDNENISAYEYRHVLYFRPTSAARVSSDAEPDNFRVKKLDVYINVAGKIVLRLTTLLKKLILTSSDTTSQSTALAPSSIQLKDWISIDDVFTSDGKIVLCKGCGELVGC
ncbi:hypothetical protein ANN_08394 [Periplaneta americana]|uniref:Uncharacterized protein n=1 Tax=Periplaneta americana TaxID=6978 RepID=A0ABQ8T2V3_PERAM|nr:hypothetical protein ANN_08394 [Periplaneta americana]